jgi:GNAT superfamily N-acetyltransferase
VDVTVRTATSADMGWLVTIGAHFTAETNWDVEFDATRAKEHFQLYIDTEGMDILVAEVNGELVGGVIVAAQYEFLTRPFGYVMKFFVMPSSRSLSITLKLISAMKDYFRVFNCSHVYLTATAGLSEREAKAFIKIMKRSGFEESGPVMWLKL